MPLWSAYFCVCLCSRLVLRAISGLLTHFSLTYAALGYLLLLFLCLYRPFGALLFGSVGGFIYNYVGICAGSIIAFFLAKHYGIPLVQAIFPSKKYNVWTERIRKAKSYDVLFGLSILLPLAPDDYLCYFSGLINMSVKKFILIILLAKPWCILFYSFGTGMIIH